MRRGLESLLDCGFTCTWKQSAEFLDVLSFDASDPPSFGGVVNPGGFLGLGVESWFAERGITVVGV